MIKYTYQVKDELNVVIRTDENGNVVSIPLNLSNADYQVYLNPERIKE